MRKTKNHRVRLSFVALAALLPISLTAELFVVNQKADLVLGQPNFTATDNVPVSASTMNVPTGVAVSPVTGKVFVSELNRHRILRFSTAASMQSGSSAEAVFGQPDEYTTAMNRGGTTAINSLNWPRQIFVDGDDRLWVADQKNHRVLYFDDASDTPSDPSADGVIGQTIFTNSSPATSQTRMSDPSGVCVDSTGRLWVADSGNNRVLRFDIPTSGNGVPASAVLGQVNFTTGTFGTSATKLNFPNRVVAGPGGVLWVSDLSNSRVLRFDDAALKANGGPADIVLGQADFSGGAENQGLPTANARTLSGPSGLAMNSRGTLFVGDSNNNRILWFENAATITTNAPANGVLGQPTLTSAVFHPAGLRSLSSASSLWCDAGNRIWVADGSFNRVLRFSQDTTAPLLTIKGKKKQKTSRSKIVIKGTASDTNGIRNVQYRSGKRAYRNARGTEVWKGKIRLKPGQNRIRIEARDTVGNPSKRQTVKIRRQ